MNNLNKLTIKKVLGYSAVILLISYNISLRYQSHKERIKPTKYSIISYQTKIDSLKVQIMSKDSLIQLHKQRLTKYEIEIIEYNKERQTKKKSIIEKYEKGKINASNINTESKYNDFFSERYN